jgi:hypothetical protein
MVRIAGEVVMRRIVFVLALCVVLTSIGTANAQFVRDVLESGSPTERVVTKPVRPVTVAVDCTRGDTINKALTKLPKKSSTETVIEIRGICEESVLVRRLENVTLRGIDPAEDGISWEVADGRPLFPYNSALMIADSYSVRIENLMLTGWRPLRLNHSDLIDVVNCRLVRMEEGRPVVYATHSNGVSFIDTEISAPGGSGLMALWSGILLTNTTVSAGPLGVAVWASTDLTLDNSSVAATWIGIYGSEGTGVWVQNSRVESDNSSLYAEFAGNIWMMGGEIAGRVLAGANSSVVLGNVTQTDSGIGHIVAERSSLNLWNGTQLLDAIYLYEFSDVIVQGNSHLFGEIHCWGGADAYCEDPGSIWGVYGCPSTPGWAAAESAASPGEPRLDLSRFRRELRELIREEQLD